MFLVFNFQRQKLNPKISLQLTLIFWH
jgi:hypothetical protein